MSSPNGSQVPSLTQIIDNYDQIWTIDIDGHILLNGVWAANGAGSKILWINQYIYALGTDTNWWQWINSSWTNIGPQQPGPHPLKLKMYWVELSDLQDKLDLWEGNIKYILRYEQYTPLSQYSSKFLFIVDES